MGNTLEQSVHPNKSAERLGTDPLGRLLFRLSLPSVISMVTVSLYNLVNTFWVAKLGYQAVAALTVVMPFFYFCVALGVGTGVGANALISRCFGERKSEAANRVAGQTLFLSLALGLILMLVTNLYPYHILQLTGATADVLELAKSYLVVLSLGMPLFFFSVISRNLFQASGDAVRPMIFVIIAQACNALLDPFFIFGWGVFPEMGVMGAAVATVIASGLGGIMALSYILTNRTNYRIRFHHCLPDLTAIAGIYRVGLPSSIMEITESIVWALFNHVVARFGSVALAAIGIAGRIGDLAFMPIIGTAHGLLPIVGFSLGAKLWHRLWRAVRLSALALAVMMAAATIMLEVFTPQMIRLFNRDPDLVSVAVPGMRIFMSTFVLAGPAVIFITTFQGLSKGRDALILSLARQFIYFVPGLYILADLMGLTGVWISLPVSDILGTLTSGLWLYREYSLRRNIGALVGLSAADTERTS